VSPCVDTTIMRGYTPGPDLASVAKRELSSTIKLSGDQLRKLVVRSIPLKLRQPLASIRPVKKKGMGQGGARLNIETTSFLSVHKQH
jgi:hypothetical protein